MLASDLIKQLANLIATHGNCPIILAEEGNEYHVTSVEAITQAPLPPKCQGVVEVGKVYFFLK